jgi:hypothetical protein
MNSVYIYHHLGLGDAIIANGMVRTIAKNYEKVYLFCKPKYFSNVSFMYRDLKHLKLIAMDDVDVISFIGFNKNNNYIIAGHKPFWKIFNTPGNTLFIDQIFYQLANVPFENKWGEFYIERDINREKSVFNQLGLKKDEEYAFIHEDRDRELLITKKRPNIKIINGNNKNFSIFDFIYTIEHTKEIHVINSSFFCLIDCLGINKENMYLHQYVRKDSDDKLNGITKSPWIIIK